MADRPREEGVGYRRKGETHWERGREIHKTILRECLYECVFASVNSSKQNDNESTHTSKAPVKKKQWSTLTSREKIQD